MSRNDHTEQHSQGYTGLEFIEGFALLAGVLWVAGAVAVGTLAFIGSSGTETATSNQTPIAESNNTPTTEPVQTVDAPAAAVPEGETPATP